MSHMSSVKFGGVYKVDFSKWNGFSRKKKLSLDDRHDLASLHSLHIESLPGMVAANPWYMNTTQKPLVAVRVSPGTVVAAPIPNVQIGTTKRTDFILTNDTFGRARQDWSKWQTASKQPGYSQFDYEAHLKSIAAPLVIPRTPYYEDSLLTMRAERAKQKRESEQASLARQINNRIALIGSAPTSNSVADSTGSVKLSAKPMTGSERRAAKRAQQAIPSAGSPNATNTSRTSGS